MNKIVKLRTVIFLGFIMIFLGYYYGYLEFIFSDYYIHTNTIININGMKFSLNHPWYINILVNLWSHYAVISYITYERGTYRIGNYITNLNIITYILINSSISICIYTMYLSGRVYNCITSRFSNRPEFIYVATPVHVIETITDNRVIPDNNGFIGTDTVCAVCLEGSDNMLNCGHHIHHRPCLMTWLNTSRTTTCPTCRTELELSKEDLLEIRNELVLTYNNNIFENILNYIHKFVPRLYYNRDLTA